MEAVADSLEVAIRVPEAYVRVHGRGSFKGGPALKQFGTAALDKGCRRIVVEMKACVGMDSTFMGVLAGLALSARKRGGEVVLREVSDKNAGLIRTLGLSHLVTLETGAAAAGPAGETLTTATDKRTLTETMLAAHETLVDVSADNLPKFKDVLAYLKEDLQNQGGAAGSGSTPP